MGTRLELNDSVQHNKETIATIISEMPPQWRAQAKKAAIVIEEAVSRIRADNSATPAPALGMAYAIFVIAEQLVNNERGDGKPLIQLLS